MRCPGSVTFIEAEEIGDESGVPAMEGTILHSFCETCLRDEVSPFDLIGEVRKYSDCNDHFKDGDQDHSYELTEDDADQIQDALDRIDSIAGKLVIEHRVNLKRWMPGQFGTLDIGIVGKKWITIWDWKWGWNPVSPVFNEQLMTYALGFWDNIARHESDATNFRLIIEQPRISSGGGVWETTLDELSEFGARLKKQAAKVLDGAAERVPGAKQCEYCPGAKNMSCPEYNKFNYDLVCQDFDELDDLASAGLPARMPRFLTSERRSFILENRAMFEKWLERMHAEALDDALKGRPVPGLKAVSGRNPPRKWKDDEAAKAMLTETLAEDAWNKKIISPAQAEKILRPSIWVKADEMVDKGKPKPILVSEFDSREPLRTVIDEFDDLD
jgi:hypothetical protein